MASPANKLFADCHLSLGDDAGNPADVVDFSIHTYLSS